VAVGSVAAHGALLLGTSARILAVKWILAQGHFTEIRRATLEIALSIDRAATDGLQAQIVDQLRRAIFAGTLAAGVRLPSTRALAEDLGVSRNVVTGAYEELLSEGYLGCL